MNRVLRYLFFGVAAVLLQTLLVPGLALVGQVPDLVVIFAVIVGAYEGSVAGSTAGFLVGLAVDIYHPPTFGAGVMAATVAGYLGGKARIVLDLDHALNQMVVLAAARIAHDLVYALVGALQGSVTPLPWLLRGTFGGAVYTALVGVAALALAGLVRQRKPVSDRR